MPNKSFFDQQDIVDVNPEMNSSPSFFEEADVIVAPKQEQVSPTQDMNMLEKGLYNVGSAVEAIPRIATSPSTLKGAEQGVTFGFADELSGLLGAGLEGAFGDDRLPQESKIDQLKRMYDEYKMAAQGRYQAAEQADPTAFMVGDIAGSILTPGGAAKTIGTGLGKAGLKTAAKQGMIMGAGSGALEAAGRTEADLMSLEGLTDVAIGTGLGTVAGGTIGKIGSKFEKDALEQAAKEAKREANVSALRAVGAKGSDFTDELRLKTSKRATEDTARGTGQTLLDEDVLKFAQSPGELKQAIVSKMDEVASTRLNPAAQKLDEVGKSVPLRQFVPEVEKFQNKVFQDIDEIVTGSQYAKGSDKALYKNMEEASDVLREEIENALQSPNRISGLLDIKRKLQSQVNWADPQANAYNEFLVKMQSNVTNLINDMSEKISPELGQQMRAANKTYSNLVSANDIVGRDLAKTLGEEGGIGFRDYLGAGVISTVADAPLLGPAVIGGKKLIESATGKKTGRMLETLDAFRQQRKLPKLQQRAAEYGGVDQAIAELTPAATMAGVSVPSAMVDSQKSDESYEKSKNATQFLKDSSPESLMAQAQRIRQAHGPSAEKLATTLEKISQKDEHGKNALLFSVMQDPNNRRMLGLSED